MFKARCQAKGKERTSQQQAHSSAKEAGEDERKVGVCEEADWVVFCQEDCRREDQLDSAVSSWRSPSLS